jgi:UDP-4-amino-4,6-dideoxy-N-acetyl-beta-L-altrosamine transaminase
LTQGPAVECFEQAVAQYCGVAEGVAVCNATAALHLACLALGLGPGDRLWTTPNTFVASANCGRYCGAEVDFVDIDPRSFNMSVPALQAKLVQAEASGRLPKIVVPVAFAGQSCAMNEIRELADRYGFAIIEDASHGIGGRYLGRPLGACDYADVVIFSFHPVKIITTGEGGMAVTAKKALAERLRRLRSHGVTREQAGMQYPSDAAWYYEQNELGYNYRMTDIQAALGTSQLRRIAEFVERRQLLASRYDEMLAGLPLITPWRHPDCDSAFHLYVVLVDTERTAATRKQIFDHLRQSDVGVNVHYIPVHLQPYYRHFGFKAGDFPVAEDYYSRCLSLPLYPSLSYQAQNLVVQSLAEVLR